VVAALLVVGALSVNVHANFNKQVLHVYSNTLDSFYEEHHKINKYIGNRDVWSIEWDAFVDAAKYSGDGPMPEIMEIGVKDPGPDNSEYGYKHIYWYGFYAGENGHVYILAKVAEAYSSEEVFIRTSYKWSTGHHYRIDVARNTVKFYIDGNLVYTVDNADNRRIYYTAAGYDEPGDIFSIYIDNVVVKKNSKTLIQEDFDDGRDNVFTNDLSSGDTDSGEEILNSTQVSEYPIYTVPIVAIATLLMATTIYSRKKVNAMLTIP
jgi:hypothetical protein